MHNKNKPNSKAKKTPKEQKKAKFPWRKDKGKWTDTLFGKSLLQNPSRMTNSELAESLEEYQLWRVGEGKYYWEADPIAEQAEMDAPFSPRVLSNLMMEAIARLKIIGDLTEGRFKKG